MGCEIIAEVASNHGGNMSLAKDFIWRCAAAGADWVKFQHTRVKHLRPDDPQYDWFKQAELTLEQFAELKAECERAQVKFLTTVYHAADVAEVVSLGLMAIKIGSGEACVTTLAGALSKTTVPRVFVSTGLTAPRDTAFWRQHRAQFLRCLTRYPCPSTHAIYAYGHRSDEAGCNVVGWSDHCVGLEGCQLAILNDASIIEKHVQLPHQARPCQPWEATMAELKQLRQFADEKPEQKYIGRWQHDIEDVQASTHEPELPCETQQDIATVAQLIVKGLYQTEQATPNIRALARDYLRLRQLDVIT